MFSVIEFPLTISQAVECILYSFVTPESRTFSYTDAAVYQYIVRPIKTMQLSASTCNSFLSIIHEH